MVENYGLDLLEKIGVTNETWTRPPPQPSFNRSEKEPQTSKPSASKEFGEELKLPFDRNSYSNQQAANKEKRVNEPISSNEYEGGLSKSDKIEGLVAELLRQK